jgi:hypothetical protein
MSESRTTTLADLQVFVRDLHLVNVSTKSVANYMTAVKSVQRIMGLDDTFDLRTNDVDSLLDRYVRALTGRRSPESVATYAARFAGLTVRFLRWTDNDPSWNERVSRAPGVHAPGPRAIRHPFRLRRDMTITLTLPDDLTTAEADRIGRFVTALAMDDTAAGETTDADLGHLRPDRLSLGGTGIFAGDWAFDGTGRLAAVGFIGTLIDRWNGWAVWSCTREVAAAVVAEQERVRAAYRAERATAGLTGTDLDTAVEETVPRLRFVGDSVVLDDPATADPTVFPPDEGGEYVICGWRWTWRAIDPADCRRIVGAIPADGDHQRWIQLPHSDLRVPHDRLRVTTLDLLDDPPNGAAFTATLTVDGAGVGFIENDGNGEETWLRSPHDLFSPQALVDYTKACRRHGRPVTATDVLDALVEEYETDRFIHTSTTAGHTVIRCRDTNGHTIRIDAVDGPFPRDARQAGQILSRYLCTNPKLGDTGWQLWTTDCWTPITAPKPPRHADTTPAADTPQSAEPSLPAAASLRTHP